MQHNEPSSVVPFRRSVDAKIDHPDWLGPRIELAAVRLEWEGDARLRLASFKAAARLEDCLLRESYFHWNDDSADAVPNLLNLLRKRAIEAAAQAGWLAGLELRDEIGERWKTIAGVEIKRGVHWVWFVDGISAGLKEQGLFESGTGRHLALPDSAKLYDEATIEALESRADPAEPSNFGPAA